MKSFDLLNDAETRRHGEGETSYSAMLTAFSVSPHHHVSPSRKTSSESLYAPNTVRFRREKRTFPTRALQYPMHSVQKTVISIPHWPPSLTHGRLSRNQHVLRFLQSSSLPRSVRVGNLWRSPAWLHPLRNAVAYPALPANVKQPILELLNGC